MKKLVKSKPFVSFLITAFVLFITPFVSADSGEATGNMIGFVYAEDGTTPVEGAVFKIQNVKTKEVFESTKTDELGFFKIEGIDPGMYLAGVVTEDQAFPISKVLVFKADTTAKLSVSLQPSQSFPLPKTIEGANPFVFLGLTGAAAWAALAAITAVLALTIADALDLFGDFWIVPESSPFKK